MAFKEYSEIADPLVLPINGKQYTIPEITIDGGIRLTEILDALQTGDTTMKITDDELRGILLGDVYLEMVEDHVPGPAVGRAIMTALTDFQKGRATAEIVWETGGDPKALAEWVQTIREAAGITTPPPGSGSGTPRKKPQDRRSASSKS